jgi:hypothetical protein
MKYYPGPHPLVLCMEHTSSAPRPMSKDEGEIVNGEHGTEWWASTVALSGSGWRPIGLRFQVYRLGLMRPGGAEGEHVST